MEIAVPVLGVFLIGALLRLLVRVLDAWMPDSLLKRVLLLRFTTDYRDL